MKKTTWILSGMMALALATSILGVTGCKKSDHEHSGDHAHRYTCSMHPEVVQDKPGTCPKCNMKLVEKK
jgi:hypothetical protein